MKTVTVSINSTLPYNTAEPGEAVEAKIHVDNNFFDIIFYDPCTKREKRLSILSQLLIDELQRVNAK